MNRLITSQASFAASSKGRFFNGLTVMFSDNW